MSTTATAQWRSRLAELADALTEADKLSSPHWQRAFRAVPRHVLVPAYYCQHDNGAWERVPTDRGKGFDAVYSNKALFTDYDERGHGVSSSSMPGLMTRMLELLDVKADHRVLEIGTGTGYNAALLTAYLGDDHVFSIDIDYVETARKRLASLGYRPTLATRDGIEGLSEHAPFDRIISTVAVPTIPYRWVEQVREGGFILADVKVGITAGNLVLLHRKGEVAHGRFDTGYAAFMRMRHPREAQSPSTPHVDQTDVRHGKTTLAAYPWETAVPWFLAGIGLPRDITYGKRFDASGGEAFGTLFSDDGSWATVSVNTDGDGNRSVEQTGPTLLWDKVEHGYRQWNDAEQPGWDRLGMTVTPTQQWIWLDQPTSERRWSLMTTV